MQYTKKLKPEGTVYNSQIVIQDLKYASEENVYCVFRTCIEADSNAYGQFTWNEQVATCSYEGKEIIL